MAEILPIKEEIIEIEGKPYIVTREIHPLYGERVSIKPIKTPEEIIREREEKIKKAEEIAKKIGVATVKVLEWIGKEAEEGLRHVAKWIEEKRKKELGKVV